MSQVYWALAIAGTWKGNYEELLIWRGGIRSKLEGASSGVRG